MNHRISVRASALAFAIATTLALSGAAVARELANFDINSHAGAAKRATETHDRDAIGRETFRWVRQPLPTGAKSAADDPEAAARAHIATLLGTAKRAGAADDLVLHKVDRQRGGAALVQFDSRVDGIEIFHEKLALLLDRDRQLIAIRGPLPRGAAKAAGALSPFTLGARDAVSAVLQQYEFAADVADALKVRKRGGEYLNFSLDDVSRSGAVVHGELRTRRIWFRTTAGLQPAWYVESRVADPGSATDGYAHVISAVDGRILFRNSLIADAHAYTYRVWAEDGADRLPYPSPQGRSTTPDPDGLPSNNNEPLVPQALRTLANAPFAHADTDGWLSTGATATSGNNVDAFADLAEPDGFDAGDLRPATTSTDSFDYTFDLAQTPGFSAAQINASTVQLFYWVNWLHDWFYDHGFAESDGNAQSDNFGRGGLGGDRISAQGQDFETEANANMFTPSDGGQPVMQMGLGAFGRDTTVDGQVIAHEWGHYLSGRLVGDASGLFTEHAAGMGEGWGDFLSLITSVKDEDRLKATNDGFAGAYGMSGYAFRHTYFGTRRYPYSIDLGKNPLTLKHIADGVALPTTPAARFGGDGSDNSEVHNQGEIWASALWECYAALLNDRERLSFAEAQNRMKDYLIGSLKLTPVAPTMVEARDAMLATVLAAGETEDFALFSAAFAKRGIGAGAQVPDRYSNSMSGVVASTAVGNALAVTAVETGVPVGCDTDTVLDAGEAQSLELTIANTGFGDVAGGSVTLSSDHPALTFPAGSTFSIGSIPVTGSTQISVPVTISGSIDTDTPITISATPAAPGIIDAPASTGTATLYAQSDSQAASAATELFDAEQNNWHRYVELTGGGTEVWSGRVADGSRVQHGPDTNSEAVIWLESPAIAVGSEPLTITLVHRYAFEHDGETAYDGGVIEVSTDGGTSWTPVDPTLAGYGDVLSDCCRNPLAGQRAYTGQSFGYPEFVPRALEFGSVYAGTEQFKIRFGIATDAAVSASGWDIDRIEFDGLTNTPFTSVVDQATSCSVPTYKSLQGSLGGAYYDATRSGEGVMIDLGQIGDAPFGFFSWYTYVDGQQLWLVGGNGFDADDKTLVFDLIETRGTNFGSGFDPADVSRTPWGTAAIAFPDCDTVELTYRKHGGEAGTLTMDRGLGRLAQGQCGTLHGGMSGIYHSPERDGEGVLVEFGSAGGNPFEFFTWYTYGSGTQQWLVGGTPFATTDGSLVIDLQNSAGAQFGSRFRSEDVVLSPWGQVTQRFVGCDTMEIDYRKADGETGTLQFTRGLQTLGDGVCR